MSAPEVSAGRFRRLCAAVIDYLLVAFVAFILLWPLGIFEEHTAYAPMQLAGRLFVLTAASYLLVNTWLLHKASQTAGKRVLGLRVVSTASGGPLSLAAALTRAFSVLALALATVFATPWLGVVLLVDVLFIFLPRRRCLHDYLVGSAVERAR